MNVLYHRTAHGKHPYTWQDLQMALRATAPLDWDSYHRLHIQGDTPLPLEKALPLLGLRLTKASHGAPQIEVDPAASPASKKLWRALIQGR
jgi:predicted metalloprotease with PDZ domain